MADQERLMEILQIAAMRLLGRDMDEFHTGPVDEKSYGVWVADGDNESYLEVDVYDTSVVPRERGGTFRLEVTVQAVRVWTGTPEPSA